MAFRPMPVDYDPFSPTTTTVARIPDYTQAVPVDYDPFADNPEPAAATPVDYDPFAAPDKTDGPGALARGFLGALQRESPASLAQSAEALGVATGYQGATDVAKDLQALAERAPADLARKVPSLSDIKGDGVLDTAGRALTYAGETLGAGVGSTIPSIVAGTAGAVAGSRAGGKIGGTVGALTGAALPSAALNYGDIYKAIKDEGVEPAKAAEYAAYALGPVVALDVGGAEGFISRLAGEARQEALRGIARRIIDEARKGVVREGLTEAAQQAVTETAASLASGKDLLTGERGMRVLESGVQGGLAGGAMGGAGGVMPDRVQAGPTQEGIPQGAVPAEQIIGAEQAPQQDQRPQPEEVKPAPAASLEPLFDESGKQIAQRNAQTGTITPNAAESPTSTVPAAPPPAPVTPEDVASPLPTADIAQGKALMGDLIQGEKKPEAAAPEPVATASQESKPVQGPTAAPEMPPVESAKPAFLPEPGVQAAEAVSPAPQPTPVETEPAPIITPPASEVPTPVRALITRTDGTPYGSERSASLSARQRADLKGRDLEPVPIEGGWGLRERVAPVEAPPPQAVSASVVAPAPAQVEPKNAPQASAAMPTPAPAERSPAPAQVEPPTAVASPPSVALIQRPDRLTMLNRQWNDIIDKQGVDSLAAYAASLASDPQYQAAIAEYVTNPGPTFAGKSPEHELVSSIGWKVRNFAPQGEFAKVMRAWGSRDAMWADRKAFVGRFMSEKRAKQEAASGRYGANMEPVETLDGDGSWALRPRVERAATPDAPEPMASSVPSPAKASETFRDPAQNMAQAAADSNQAARDYQAALGGILSPPKRQDRSVPDQEEFDRLQGDLSDASSRMDVELGTSAAMDMRAGIAARLEAVPPPRRAPAASNLPDRTLSSPLGAPGAPSPSRVNPAARTEKALEASIDRAIASRTKPTLSKQQRGAVEDVRAEIGRRFDAAIDEARANPGGTVTIRIPTARGRETIITALRDPAGLNEMKRRYQGLDDVSLYRLPQPSVIPQFSEAVAGRRAELGAALRRELDRIGLKDIALRLPDRIDVMLDGRKVGQAEGRYNRGIIDIAMHAVDPAHTLSHEAIHALHRLGLFSTGEWNALTKAANEDWRARLNIAGRYGRLNASDAVQVEEAIADAYAAWRSGKLQVGGFAQRAFNQMRKALEAIGRVLREKGFTRAADLIDAASEGLITPRSALERINEGVVGRRERANPVDADMQDRALVGSPDETVYSLPSSAQEDSPETAEGRQSIMIKALNRHPIDRAIRIPFDYFGGLDQQGRWKPGLYLSGRASDIITTAKVPENFPLSGAINGVLHRARIGLIDRYGLDPAYVERDRQRGLEERRTLLKVPDIIESIGKDLQPDEYAALHAVLTGEQVGDNRWASIAAPIRDAIDQMGQEAVDLGLLSPEAYERNKGKYLHRVYAKNEMDEGAGSLINWVNRLSNSRRKKIIGDQFRGRGIFVEVPAGKLLANTDEMQTLRKRNVALRMLESRRAELIRRRGIAEARVEEGSQEMASTLERRVGTTEASKALQRKGGATVVLKPSSYQKGQAREQGVALTRLQRRGSQARALMDKIDGQLSEINSKIVDIETRIFAAEEIAPKAGTKFTMLDKMGEDKASGEPKVTARAYVPDGAKPDSKYDDYQDKGTWEVRGTKGGKVILWRDFTKSERERMGEIVDARYGIAKTFMQAARDLSTGRFFKDIAENREWARNAEPAEGTWVEASEFNRMTGASEDIGWVKVPDTKIPKTDTKRYGALSGMFVRAEIWRDLAETEALSKPGVWDAVLRQWKLNKTARNPVAHMNNVMSNMVFADMADIRAGDLAQAVRSMHAQDATYQEAVENGAFGSDMVAQDLRRDILEPILAGLRQDARAGKGGLEGALEAMGPEFAKKGALLARLADRTFSGAKWLDDKMLRAYQVEDEVFRMASYIRSRAKGLDAKTAAINARDTFLNYDIKAPWINAARRSVLPFIAYAYRAAPMVAKTVAARPWKLAKYATIAYALNALAYALAPGDEDEERRSMRREEQGMTWIGTDRMMRMPFYDQFGNPMFLDIRRWMPVGDIFEVGRGVGAVDLPSIVTPTGPLMLAGELLLNRSAFTGQDIVNPLTDTTGEKISKSADYLWKAWMPSAPWVPGSWYWTRIADAAAGATDYQGRAYSVPQALASSVGIKLKSQDVREAQYWQSFEFGKVERELMREARSISRRKDRNLITKAEYDAEMAELVEKMNKLGVESARVLDPSQLPKGVD